MVDKSPCLKMILKQINIVYSTVCTESSFMMTISLLTFIIFNMHLRIVTKITVMQGVKQRNNGKQRSFSGLAFVYKYIELIYTIC